MINIRQTYMDFCQSKGISYRDDDSILSYDDTTLFCPAGMQQFKKDFKDKEIKNVTRANIQSCLRMQDIDTVGDGTHFPYFHMMGLFSFRGLTVKKSIDFWMEYLTLIGIKPDYVTIHSHKTDWAAYYYEYDLEVRIDNECIWSDGELSGYCTEFYVNSYLDNIEIGNIVNICDDCIDVGFGYERLDHVVNKTGTPGALESLEDTIGKLLACKVYPSNKQQGYVTRRLIRKFHGMGGVSKNLYFIQEKERQEKALKQYDRLKRRNPDKSKQWWFDTHGIDLDLVNE